MPGHRAALLLAPACAGLLLAGCTASSDGPKASSASASSTAPTSASASPSPSPTATGFTVSCEDALSLTAVSKAAGQPIIGSTAFVVGEADASIGRLAYLNCRYGLPTPTSKTPAVEIGVSLYDSAARAIARVAGTIEDYRSSGSTAAPLAVGSATGTVLTTRGQPRTLVLATGARTVAVSLTGAVYTGSAQLAAIAALAVAAVR